MIHNYKFLKGFQGTLGIMDGMTAMTASFFYPSNRWTPEESERIRIERMRISNEVYNEMSQNFERNRIAQQQRRLDELLENIERQGQLLERQVDSALSTHLSLFGATSTITVKPTFWTKVKMFGTKVKLFFKECFKQEPLGLIVATLLMCLVSLIGIMKLFGA